MTSLRLPAIALCATVFLTSCATTAPPAPDKKVDPGSLWVLTSAEYKALALQAYRAATDALPAKLADTAWSALPEQTNAADLPPAIVFDIDETVVTNAQFQLDYIPPFSDAKFDAWNAANKGVPVPGVVEFAKRARAMGIELFFVTNRACDADAATGDACPQKQTVVDDVNEAGVPVTADRVMLALEQPAWNREKKNRRDVIAKNYRIIMLFGDDLNDFITCSRQRAVPPCTAGATRASRDASTTGRYRDYWGNGWYVLPNPMHGSWTSVH